jgi:TPR repeat protein
VEWWRKAADQGDVSAMNNLGRAYHEGFGVSKDTTQAVEWWRKAAQAAAKKAEPSPMNPEH